MLNPGDKAFSALSPEETKLCEFFSQIPTHIWRVNICFYEEVAYKRIVTGTCLKLGIITRKTHPDDLA
jgi:hypothetical protein